jgi:hypothetical protein
MADDRDFSTETRSSLETVRSMLADLDGMKREEIHNHLVMALKVMIRTSRQRGNGLGLAMVAWRHQGNASQSGAEI